ncbi:hypothetical protein M378DRAFT_17216 [Amanita muscaria Koide BX008]|uniref:Uncharacterized protein n=1 Tax=Amanita muscaria (strain Koide BX008) TaxID=946122 RepID=A0A0C2WJF3_AMAMK|nr:hypothetical protein M378DRAFT_17216 [Amanita muscaria Koide BX008]
MNGTGTGEWAVVDKEGVAQITRQTGLMYLMKIPQRMLRGLDIIMGRSRRSSPVNNVDIFRSSFVLMFSD